ncbi:hypothetical protein CDAR_622371 [Caerostris darwini]|uniref:Uncharacterized protein n=1 Tax=Caerostris darwini TaxID=1538125 RepID=A0AAV4W183_9ARAC|nr:hypothetical protein CDAR_622371 [Caerostris darwini]
MAMSKAKDQLGKTIVLCLCHRISVKCQRMFKGDCPKPDDENWPALATFVGQRSELEVNSPEIYYRTLSLECCWTNGLLWFH